MRLILVLLILIPSLSISQNLVVNYHGDSNDEPILFLHGGPNGSSKLVEVFIADSLVNRGYFVITYDRRGEGRSKDSTAQITYDEMIQDINNILNRAGVERVTLISSSLGGYVGAKYAYRHPDRVKRFIMTENGLNLQVATDSLLKELAEKFEAENDNEKLSHAEFLIDANKNCNNGIPSMALTLVADADIIDCENKITPESDSVRAQNVKTSNRNLTSRAHELWAANNNFICEDLSDEIEYIISKGVKMRAILGDNELMISDYEIDEMNRLMGKENVVTIKNGCHGILIFRMEETLHHIFKALPKSG